MAVVVQSVAAVGWSLAAGAACDKPVGTVENDLLVAHVSEYNGGTITPPDGSWQALPNSASGSYGFWKIAGASEPATYTFTSNVGLGTGIIQIQRITGHHSSSPIAAAGAYAYTANTPTVVLPSVTASTAGSGLVQSVATINVSLTWTPPGTTTERYDQATVQVTGSVAGGDETVGVGATGTRTWTPNANANGTGLIVAVNPAAGGGGGGAGLQRALTLYPRNSTTVDTGTGIDVRLLANTNGNTLDVTQSVAGPHTADGQERTFNPADTAVTAVEDARTLQKKGWALRLTEDMTPADDILCDVMLPAQTVTVNLNLRLQWVSGTISSNTTITPRAALFKYNPATDTGTLIADGSGTALVWTSLQNNTFKAGAVSIVIPSNVVFAAGEILLLQVGVQLTTLANPLSGTTTHNVYLQVDAPLTNVVLASRLVQACAVAQSIAGDGSPTRGALANTITRTLAGDGLPSYTKFSTIVKAFSLIGEAIVSRVMALTQPRNVVGEGTPSMSRSVAATRTTTVVGDGVPTREPLLVTLARSTVGDGLADGAKAVLAFRTATVAGEGVVTDTHPVQAYRTFTVGGDGVTTRQLAITQPRDVIGEAVVNGTKAVVAAKTFAVAGEGVVTRVVVVELSRSVVGEGFVSDTHPVQAFRTFTATGEGQVVMEGANGSRIELPLADLPQPEGGATQTVIRPVIVFDD